jgi:hypothetical protein
MQRNGVPVATFGGLNLFSQSASGPYSFKELPLGGYMELNVKNDFKTEVFLGVVAHACNPSYLRGRDQKDLSWRPAWVKSPEPYLNQWLGAYLFSQLLEKHKWEA